MGLPVSDPKSVFPPASHAVIFDKMREWDAWYSNDLDKLADVYGGASSGGQAGQAFYGSDTGKARNFVSRTLQRWFVGERQSGNGRNTKLPIPVAAEMCQASSDLMMSEPFTVTVGDETTQNRIDDLLDEEFMSTYAEAAELCAAHGGVYLLVSWDPDLVDHPFPTIKTSDMALPEFRFGRLTAVTFWSVIRTDEKNTYRHVERHELDTAGNGIIRHGLYEGTSDTLGFRISLLQDPSTAALAAHNDVNDEGTINTGPGLAVEYIPNQTPNRDWRQHPVGRNLGRADIDGVEHLIDQLAETMSDWMRARRVARARIAMSSAMAQKQGAGKGTVVDLQQETYLLVDTLGRDIKLADQIEVLQPTFDPAGYKATAEELLEQILQLAGYSMQTFGVGDTGTIRTATEINSKERRSLMTRGRKLREWLPALFRHLSKLLDVDTRLFKQHNNVAGLAIEFSDGVQETQISLAQTVLALYQAESASIEERIGILHPDWDEKQIGEEADKIREEFAHALPAPELPPFNDPGVNDGAGEPAAQ